MWDMKGIDLRRSVYADDYELLEQLEREVAEREERDFDAYLERIEQEKNDGLIKPRRMPDVSSFEMDDDDLDLDLE